MNEARLNNKQIDMLIEGKPLDAGNRMQYRASEEVKKELKRFKEGNVAEFYVIMLDSERGLSMEQRK